MILIYKFAIIDLYFEQIGQSLPTTSTSYIIYCLIEYKIIFKNDITVLVVLKGI